MRFLKAQQSGQPGVLQPILQTWDRYESDKNLLARKSVHCQRGCNLYSGEYAASDAHNLRRQKSPHSDIDRKWRTQQDVDIASASEYKNASRPQMPRARTKTNIPQSPPNILQANAIHRNRANGTPQKSVPSP